jgi:hypothetical protein
MKYFAAAAILALMASSTAWGQVYGGEDDPYQQSPFASNSYVPPPQETPAPASGAPATVATPASATSAPAAAATTPDSGKPQQAAASSQPAKTQP